MNAEKEIFLWKYRLPETKGTSYVLFLTLYKSQPTNGEYWERFLTCRCMAREHNHGNSVLQDQNVGAVICTLGVQTMILYFP